MAAFARPDAGAEALHASAPTEINRFPRGPHTFDAQFPACGGPLDLVKYERQRFEWPSPCPFILVPLCNGFPWYGDAHFEPAHHGELLRFRRPTLRHAWLGTDAQVVRCVVDEDAVFLAVTQSSNEVERGLGWSRVVPR